MGLFDKMKQAAANVSGNQTVTFTFQALIVVIMQKAEQQVGLVIDELIGQQETVIKSLGHHITCDKLFSGATILGDGEVALILDTNTLM